MKSERLRELLIRHEGKRLKPYVCTAGKLSIGVGRNLDDVGISDLEANLLLTHDIERVLHEAVNRLPWFKGLNLARQDVVLSMVFNLGMTRFLGFKKAIEAMRLGNFDRAASEMLDSKWAVQVGERAIELARMMRSGLYL